jgi:acyl dehydratase
LAVDPEKLRAFAIPERTQAITPADAVLYALSIGMGQDPLDERDLDFLLPERGPRMVPSMALVLAHPGFWLADPASGVNPGSVLHAEQGFEILAPLSAAGVVRSRTRITDLIDKGEGKAAILLTETMLEDGEGRPLARLERSSFLRGEGGFGGENRAVPPPPPPPDRAPDHRLRLTTRPEQALLYRLNGDLNPLHADPATARAAGFDRPILHGLCTAGAVCSALLRTLAGHDERRIRSVRLRFAAPLFPGETIVADIWSDGSFRARAEERDVLVVDGGRAEIAPPNSGE